MNPRGFWRRVTCLGTVSWPCVCSVSPSVCRGWACLPCSSHPTWFLTRISLFLFSSTPSHYFFLSFSLSLLARDNDARLRFITLWYSCHLQWASWCHGVHSCFRLFAAQIGVPLWGANLWGLGVWSSRCKAENQTLRNVFLIWHQMNEHTKSWTNCLSSYWMFIFSCSHCYTSFSIPLCFLWMILQVLTCDSCFFDSSLSLCLIGGGLWTDGDLWMGHISS